MYPSYPQSLSQGEFARVRFSLELLDDGQVRLDQLLGMRRLLRRAASDVLGASALALFEPPLSCDPAALRRFQKPAPGFVLIPALACAGTLREGDRIALEVFFLGDAVRSIADFGSVLQQLGKQGLTDGHLRFELAAIACLEPGGSWRSLPFGLQPGVDVVPGLMRLDQWLDQSWPGQLPVTFEFVTPVRLVAGGRVLRRPRFDQLFPFLLRRVTSMLHAYCALEPVEDPGLILSTARDEIQAVWDKPCWVDWRDVGNKECLGGLTGTLRLAGRGLDDVLWVMLLATLFGVGKGAAYGAGRCRVLPAG